MSFYLSKCAIIAVCISVCTASWPQPIAVENNKFFEVGTGFEFRIKGVAYYPRPNAGKLSGETGVDYTTDDYEFYWKDHVAEFIKMNVNTVRLYSVDPGQSHDKFMCALAEANIHVMVGLAAPCKNCAIQNGKPPGCYPDELLTRGMMIYNAFAVYDNVLGFSVGNENNLQPGKTTTAPCVKAFLRDMRNYAESCSGSLREVPIGLDQADILPREDYISYYDCVVNENEFTRAQWQGFNPYVFCNNQITDYSEATGLRDLMKEYKALGYSRPLILGEYGCNLDNNTIDGWENQRSFKDAYWMNTEPEMMAEIVGGNAFEFSSELANRVDKQLSKKADPGEYGLYQLSPKTCDIVKVPCELIKKPEVDNLANAYATTPNSTVNINTWKPTRDNILSCPKGFSIDLPATPKVKQLKCSVAQPVCNGKKANSFKKKDKKVKMGDVKKPSNSLESNVDSTTVGTNDESSGAVSMFANSAIFAVFWLSVALLLH